LFEVVQVAAVPGQKELVAVLALPWVREPVEAGEVSVAAAVATFVGEAKGFSQGGQLVR
jgi:hypothetical protein